MPAAGALDDYEELRRVGRGSEGTVFLVRQKSTGLQFVIKKILCVPARHCGDMGASLAC